MILNIYNDHYDVVIDYPTRDPAVMSHMETLELSNKLPEPYRSELMVAANKAGRIHRMTQNYRWQ